MITMKRLAQKVGLVIIIATLFFNNLPFFSLKNNNSFTCTSSQWLLFGAAQAQAQAQAQATMAAKIGVVLEKESLEGKIGLSFINMAISDFYATHPHFNTRIVVHVRDSKHYDALMAAAAVLDLIKNEQVVAIIGPETLSAQFVVNLGAKAQVPIVSYSSENPFLSPLHHPYFVRVAQDEYTQVQPIKDLIQAFGWREVVPIYLADEFGGGIMPFLADVLLEIGIRTPSRSIIPLSATDVHIEAELYRLKSMSTRVFLVQMEASLGSRLFWKANQLEMMGEDYVWIITNRMANALESLDFRVIQSMQGVLGVSTYVPRTRELEDVIVRWETQFRQANPLLANARMNIDGIWAYDATIALAIAVEEIGITNFIFERAESRENMSNDISEIAVSCYGPQLLQAVLRSKFKGLSGKFDLVYGQLRSTVFKLINVVGIGGKCIRYWTPSSGFVKNLTLANNTSNVFLDSVRWPGNPASIPKGWVVSPNGKKLKIGVPIKNGFHQFVTVTRDPRSNITEVTGYCIDVFDAVVKKLPYSVLYEYIPFAEDGAQPNYDTLISQVYLKKFDAVVGDVTIRENRTLYVDFTFPYTESGVIMVVPMKRNDRNRAWLFVKPLTWKLWLTTFCSFIFIAFVVWVLEHRINEDFRGPLKHHVGTSLYYSFSTIVFSHSFNVVNNLTRFVVIIWVFVLLILVQSYTANLTSLLTVQQLQPAIKSVNEIIKSGENVGYQQGSFVWKQLMQMGFNDSKLKTYNSTQSLDELLTKGTERGGISAAFDELPYVKVFLAEYCSKYTMVPPIYKTDGFGFVFPKGSPLGEDVSRKVLSVTEGKEMTSIENKWFKKRNCPDSSSIVPSRSLNLDSFWVLFTISGAVAIFALIITLARFFREHKSTWSDRNATIGTKIRTLVRIFDQKNPRSHTFRKSHPRDQISLGTSNSPRLRSPTSYFINSEREFSNVEGQPNQLSENNYSNSSVVEISEGENYYGHA